MKRPLLAFSFVALLSAAAFAGGLDDFKVLLEDTRTIKGAGEALTLVDKRLASATDNGADLVSLHLLRGDLLAQEKRFDEALGEWTTKVLESPEGTPSDKALAAEKAYHCLPREEVRKRRDLLAAAFRQLGGATGEPKARLLELKGLFGEALGYADIAGESFREAAALHPDPARRAALLLKASDAALRLRDKETARKDCEAIVSLEGLPPETVRIARIRLAAIYLVPDQYDWTLSRDDFEKASSLLAKAIPASSAHPLPREAMEGRVALFHGAIALGDGKTAERLGKELLDDVRFRDWTLKALRGEVLLTMGDLVAAAGRHREALRYYEETLPLQSDKRPVRDRIARSAEAAKDYVKAMDAYASCLRDTDKERHPADHRRYKTKVEQMSGYLRKNAPKPTAEELFDDDFDDAGGITLDEE